MKIRLTLFILSCLFSLQAFSQINNWDSVSVDAFGTNRDLYNITHFNNALYVGLKRSGPAQPEIYTSTTGDIGSWTASTFSAAASPNDEKVQTMAPDEAGGVLYTGVSNYTAGASIYAFNGSSWTLISGAVPPWSASVTEVKKIILYSSGGGNDSIFAYLYDPMNQVSQVWKTSGAVISWSLVVELPNMYVNDAVVYNDSIFFAVYNNLTAYSYVYRMNGDGDTVKTHLDPGVNDEYNDIVCLRTHNNFLYAGTYHSAWIGASLLKYSPATSWVVLSSDGLGYGGDLVTIVDIYFYRNKYWILGVGQFGSFDMSGARTAEGHHDIAGGPATVEIFVSTDETSFRQCATSGLRSASNSGSDWNLSHLGDNIYAAGYNFSSGGGQVWRSSVPQAAFSFMYSATCANMMETYTNLSVNAFSYKWYVNGSLISTATSPNYSYPSPGTYTVSLVAYSADLLYSDSVSATQTVTQALNLTANSITTCEDVNYPLGSAIIGLSGGTAPYAYNWTNGTNVYTGANPVHQVSSNSTFTLSVMDANFCVTTQTLSVNGQPSTDLHGHVSTLPPASLDVDNGLVYIFRHQPGSAAFDTVGFALLDANGDYLFTPLTAGDYLIKVMADEITFPDAVPTYYGNEFQWDSSIVFTHGCAQTDTADIVLIEADNAPGTATVSGYILEGDGYGTARYGVGPQPNLPFIPGGPLKGIDVKLGKNPSTGIQARTMSDTTGFYEFTSVPPGGYKIYVDIPNLPMDSTRELIIVPSDSSVQNNYYADSSMIYVIDTLVVPVGIYASGSVYENGFSIYPNPAKGAVYVNYSLKQSSKVSFEISDATGRVVRKEPYRKTPEGKNIFIFNTEQLNLQGGVYFISILMENKKFTQRIVVIE